MSPGTAYELLCYVGEFLHEHSISLFTVSFTTTSTVTMASFAPSRLLDLPFEIRALVLGELLRDPDAILFEGDPGDAPRSQKLYTSIIRTCRQLREEGEAILYANTIKCVVGGHLWQSRSGSKHAPIFLKAAYCAAFTPKAYGINGPSYVYNNMPSGLRHRVQKLEIEVIVDEHRDTQRSITKIFAPDLSNSIHLLVDFLRAQEDSYKHLNITLRISPDALGPWVNPLHTDAQQRERFDQLARHVRGRLLYPLTYLRNRTSLRIHGVTHSLANRLHSLRAAAHMSEWSIQYLRYLVEVSKSWTTGRRRVVGWLVGWLPC